MILIFYAITHAIISIILFLLGLWVIFRRKGVMYISFSFLAWSVSLWAMSYCVWLLSSNYNSALFWSRTLNMFATFIPFFYLYWMLDLLKLHRKKILLIDFFVTIFFILFSYSRFYIKDVKQVLQFSYWPQAGWLYILFLIFAWAFIIMYGFYLLIREFKKSQGYYRLQLKYVIWGSIVGFIGGSNNYLLMFDIDLIPPIGSLLVGVYPVIIAYAIVPHNLMDIKLTLRKYFVLSSSLISIFAIVILLKIITYRYIPDVFLVRFMIDFSVFFTVTFTVFSTGFFLLGSAAIGLSHPSLP
jgi:hypothetical protein